MYHNFGNSPFYLRRCVICISNVTRQGEISLQIAVKAWIELWEFCRVILPVWLANNNRQQSLEACSRWACRVGECRSRH